MAMNLSAFTVLKNGVSLGYPFIESILSLLPACDEFVISEGYSDDDTYHWLERLRRRHPDKIRLVRERWPEGLPGGQAIARMQTRTLRKCRGRWVYLLQSDEIMPEKNVPYLRDLCRPRRPLERLVGRRRFNSYTVDFMHLHDQFQRLDTDPGYRWAIRMVRNRRFITSDGDGWQFYGPGCSLVGVARLPLPVYHVGYCFPVNVWRKRVNQALLYPEDSGCLERAEEARQRLAEYERGALPSITSANPLGIPPILAPLIGQWEYQVREELFA